VLVATGCEEAGQRGARKALQSHLESLPGSGGYDVGAVHCTRNGRYAIFQSVRTKRYYCTARQTESGDCDLFRVDARPDGSAAILRVKQDAGCVLPVG